MSISALQGQGYDDSLVSKHNHYMSFPQCSCIQKLKFSSVKLTRLYHIYLLEGHFRRRRECSCNFFLGGKVPDTHLQSQDLCKEYTDMQMYFHLCTPLPPKSSSAAQPRGLRHCIGISNRVAQLKLLVLKCGPSENLIK